MTISPSPTFAPPWATVTRLIWLAMAIALFGVFAIGLALTGVAIFALRPNDRMACGCRCCC